MRRSVLRWLTRPSRVPRSLRWTVAVVLGSASLVGLAAPSSPAAKRSKAPAPVSARSLSRPSRAGATTTGSRPGPTPATKSGTGEASSLAQVTRAARALAAQMNPLAADGGPPDTSPNTPSKAPEPPGPGNSTKTFPTSPALVDEGFNLYEESCSSCHGVALQGKPATAPALVNVGAGPVDFYLSTGRMPLQDPKDEPQRTTPAFNRTQIDALVDFISSFGGPPAPATDAKHGSIALGMEVFTEDCAGCHQIVARGGLTVGAQVPNLLAATGQEIAEAVRMGPYVMPHFDAKEINQHQLDSLARYILYTRRPDNAGGWGIYNIGPIPEGMVAWFIGLASLVIVARLIGERAYEQPSTRGDA